MDLTALPLLAAQTVIAAASTDAWGAAKQSVARLFGRDREQATERRLDQAQRELASAGPDREAITGRLVSAWETRLADLLEEQPGIADDLETLVKQLQATVPASAASATDHSVAAGRDVRISAPGGIAAGVISLGPTKPDPAGH